MDVLRRRLATSGLMLALALVAVVGAFAGRPGGRWDGYSVGLLVVAALLVALSAANATLAVKAEAAAQRARR